MSAKSVVRSRPAPATTSSPAQLERLGEHLRKLRLLKSGERLEALLQQAAAQELPYADFLEQVLGEEVAAKTSRNITMRTAMARFPFVQPLETSSTEVLRGRWKSCNAGGIRGSVHSSSCST